MKHCIYLVLFFGLSSQVFGQERALDSSDWPIVQVPEEVLDAWEAQFEKDEGSESTYRTSDQKGERGTNFRHRLGEAASYAQVEGGQRTACICMDGERRMERGRGACSGRGGVRYWVYRMPDGAEVLYPTARQREHPADLNTLEVSNLAAHNENVKAERTVTFKVNSLYEWATALAVCSIMALFFKHLYQNHEFFHQLRHRR